MHPASKFIEKQQSGIDYGIIRMIQSIGLVYLFYLHAKYSRTLVLKTMSVVASLISLHSNASIQTLKYKSLPLLICYCLDKSSSFCNNSKI